LIDLADLNCELKLNLKDLTTENKFLKNKLLEQENTFDKQKIIYEREISMMRERLLQKGRLQNEFVPDLVNINMLGGNFETLRSLENDRNVALRGSSESDSRNVGEKGKSTSSSSSSDNNSNSRTNNSNNASNSGNNSNNNSKTNNRNDKSKGEGMDENEKKKYEEEIESLSLFRDFI
jgi:hypothetical protein